MLLAELRSERDLSGREVRLAGVFRSSVLRVFVPPAATILRLRMAAEGNRAAALASRGRREAVQAASPIVTMTEAGEIPRRQ
jgi:hypothetical protein